MTDDGLQMVPLMTHCARRHYLYVMIRVLRLAQDDPLVWQKALLTTEAEEARQPPYQAAAHQC